MWSGKWVIPGHAVPVYTGLPMLTVLTVIRLRQRRIDKRILPRQNQQADNSRLSPRSPFGCWCEVLPGEHLLMLTAHLSGTERLDYCFQVPVTRAARTQPDLQDVRGQYQPRRALEIAAAGGHSLLMLWLQYPTLKKQDSPAQSSLHTNQINTILRECLSQTTRP